MLYVGYVCVASTVLNVLFAFHASIVAVSSATPFFQYSFQIYLEEHAPFLLSFIQRLNDWLQLALIEWMLHASACVVLMIRAARTLVIALLIFGIWG